MISKSSYLLVAALAALQADAVKVQSQFFSSLISKLIEEDDHKDKDDHKPIISEPDTEAPEGDSTSEAPKGDSGPDESNSGSQTENKVCHALALSGGAFKGAF